MNGFRSHFFGPKRFKSVHSRYSAWPFVLMVHNVALRARNFTTNIEKRVFQQPRLFLAVLRLRKFPSAFLRKADQVRDSIKLPHLTPSGYSVLFLSALRLRAFLLRRRLGFFYCLRWPLIWYRPCPRPLLSRTFLALSVSGFLGRSQPDLINQCSL